MWIALVQVGHAGYEPSIDCLAHVHFSGIGVHHGSELVGGLQVSTLGWFGAVGISGKACHRVASALLFRKPFGRVQPVFRRQVTDPRVLETAMVEYHVHNDFQTLLVGFADKAAVVVVGAEARVNTIVVGSGIAVIGGEAVVRVGRVVLQHWSKP